MSPAKLQQLWLLNQLIPIWKYYLRSNFAICNGRFTCLIKYAHEWLLNYTNLEAPSHKQFAICIGRYLNFSCHISTSMITEWIDLNIISWTRRESQEGFRWEPEGHYHYHWEPEGASRDVLLRTRRVLSLFKGVPLRTRRVLSLFKGVPLRTRRALSLFKVVPLRTRRALSLFKGVSVENQTSAIAIALYGDNAFLVLNRTFLI